MKILLAFLLLFAPPAMRVEAPPLARVGVPFTVTIVHSHPDNGTGYSIDPRLHAVSLQQVSDVATRLTFRSDVPCACTFTLYGRDGDERTVITTTVTVITPTMYLGLLLS